jgi:hypothetical protein
VSSKGRFFERPPARPRARLGLFPPAFAFALPQLAAMERTAFYCGECWRFLHYSVEGWSDPTVTWSENAITWITCDRCLARLEGRDPPLVGRQPAICQGCRQPFEATRQQQRFCSSSCRARSWRAQRTAAVS